SISTDAIKKMLLAGAERVIEARNELTDIDSRFGDADHGITMEKIMTALAGAVQSFSGEGGVKALMDDVSMAIMTINGGSAVPLWTTLFDGLSEGASSSDEMSLDELKAMFRRGLEAFKALSKAKVGDKTMTDALEPAVEVLCACNGGLAEVMKAAAEGAEAGAAATVNFTAKFGRAKSYGERTIGTPDAGAMSMKYFFRGLAEGAGE
ncbi:MAG: DAK2 domain-containing protein, partial [Synergistaceae bacterium]|nr:DAK2 domain-containing protein [Synergistaceae bacterium]